LWRKVHNRKEVFIMIYSEERKRVWSGMTGLGLSFDERSKRLRQWDESFNTPGHPLNRLRIGITQAIAERLPENDEGKLLQLSSLSLHWKRYSEWDNGWGAFIPKPTLVAVPGFEATLSNRSLVEDALWWEVAYSLDFQPAMVDINDQGEISFSSVAGTIRFETAKLPEWIKPVLPWARVWALVEGVAWSAYRATSKDILDGDELSLVSRATVPAEVSGPMIDYPFIFLHTEQGLCRAAENLARQSPLAPPAP
jgi:hypothetical protein